MLIPDSIFLSFRSTVVSVTLGSPLVVAALAGSAAVVVPAVVSVLVGVAVVAAAVSAAAGACAEASVVADGRRHPSKPSRFPGWPLRPLAGSSG